MHRLALGLFCAASLAAQAMAQDRILHVGLREDPDLLDPTLGSSYVGRIVFSGICDKLFDIDAKLNIVPVLATGYEWKDPLTSSSTSATACCSRTAKSSTPKR